MGADLTAPFLVFTVGQAMPDIVNIQSSLEKAEVRKPTPLLLILCCFVRHSLTYLLTVRIKTHPTTVISILLY